ncbi:MAG: GNAT family N-acetyltransferase [Deltaproteobacteria bacterium]|nr:GNAT family N-acetyltransferase [Deltaproteobacteria bacterium]
MENLAISVRRATPRDAPALAELVNEAYAIEKTFLDGDRCSEEEIAEMCEPGSRGVFLVLEQAGGLAAAVWLERRGGAGYFGMLSVRPGLQGMGLGKRLVRIAEAMAEATGATEMTLRIINLREELARWYKSLGYREVGTAPFADPRSLKRPCHFVEMSKDLAVGAGVSAGMGAA